MNGLHIKKHSEIDTEVNSLNLLVSHKDLEVVFGNIPEKGGIIVSAYNNPSLIEVIYILEGKFEYYNNGVLHEVCKGDCIYHNELSKSFTMYAAEDSKVLTFSNTKEYIPVNNDFNKLYDILYDIQSKDHYTEGHCRRVGLYSQKLANNSVEPLHSMRELMIVANTHDVGKCKVPDEVLLKPGRFNEEERNIMNKHSLYSYELLKNEFGFSETIAMMAACHHERYDGSGYPFGLKGNEIPIESRIIAIADTFDAMTTTRPYQKARTAKEAIEEMNKFSYQYDPILFKIFKDLINNKVIEILA